MAFLPLFYKRGKLRFSRVNLKKKIVTSVTKMLDFVNFLVSCSLGEFSH